MKLFSHAHLDCSSKTKRLKNKDIMRPNSRMLYFYNILNKSENATPELFAIYEGCPSKSWTFVTIRDCVPVIL